MYVCYLSFYFTSKERTKYTNYQRSDSSYIYVQNYKTRHKQTKSKKKNEKKRQNEIARIVFTVIMRKKRKYLYETFISLLFCF